MKHQKTLLTSLLLALLLMETMPAALAYADTPWDPHVSVVWPQDGQGNPTSVAESREVNISVWPINQVECSGNPLERAGLGPEFYLWMIKDNEPAQRMDIPGQLVMRTIDNVSFPSVEYDNVAADMVANPTSRFRFIVGPAPLQSNLWVHAADARTFNPEPVAPVGYGEPSAGNLDSRIQIVWPHDEKGNQAAVDRAMLVNIAVDLFIHGTRESVPIDFQPTSLNLNVAIGNGLFQTSTAAGQPYARAEKTTYTVNGRSYPRWVFNDVPVDPRNQYNFAAPVLWGKVLSPYITVWTHAADARTYLPNPQVPPGCKP